MSLIQANEEEQLSLIEAVRNIHHLTHGNFRSGRRYSVKRQIHQFQHNIKRN